MDPQLIDRIYECSFVPELWPADDVRHNSVKRVASAVGEGAMAVTFAHRFLAETA
jgi:thioredoxin reductase (NADPH)